MAFGSKDTKGIYKYGEDDTKTTFSELLNTGMDSVSDAARAFSGTAAQRAAFLDAAPGSIWQDTNGTKQLWRWLDGSWKLLNLTIAEGGTGATTVAGAQKSLRVGLVPISPVSVEKAGTGSTASANTLGQVTFASCTSLSLNGVFTSGYRNYKIIFESLFSADGNCLFRLRKSGADNTVGQYIQTGVGANENNSISGLAGYLNHLNFGFTSTTRRTTVTMDVISPLVADWTKITAENVNISASADYRSSVYKTMHHASNETFDGFTFYSSTSATMSGIVQVFGYNE